MLSISKMFNKVTNNYLLPEYAAEGDHGHIPRQHFLSQNSCKRANEGNLSAQCRAANDPNERVRLMFHPPQSLLILTNFFLLLSIISSWTVNYILWLISLAYQVYSWRLFVSAFFSLFSSDRQTQTPVGISTRVRAFPSPTSNGRHELFLHRLSLSFQLTSLPSLPTQVE